jgi:hypothetical protein
MAVKLSPFGPNPQFVDANGNPASGYKLFFYAAGSSTKQNTYTDSTGNTANSNPIVLNSLGQAANAIWFTEGLDYKAVFAPSTDTDPPSSAVWTRDDLSGINDTSLNIDQWVASGLTPTYVSATQFTLVGDQTSAFHVNRRVKFTVTAGTVYGYISVSAYTTLTTVTVVLDSGSLDSGLSAVSLGVITSTNTSLPQISDWVKSAMVQDDAILARMLGDSTLGFALINGTLTATVGSSALTVAIKTKAGTDPSSTDPVLVVFRSSTLTSGVYNVRSVTAATSVVVSSGSTLGTTSAVQSQINVIAIDNAGTVELAVVNNSGALLLDETTLISTTAEGGAGAADSADVYYSTSARASVPYRNIGYVISTQATAGTWASSPTQIQLLSTPQIKSGWTYLAEQASTSGTSIDFTGIPSWATEVVVMFAGVSTNGTSDVILQIGDAGGIETSGYLGACSALAGAASTSNFTAGYGLSASSAAANVYHGNATLHLEDASDNTWTATSTLARSDGAQTHLGSGSKPLSATLTQLRITTVGGANTFDAGVIRVKYR